MDSGSNPPCSGVLQGVCWKACLIGEGRRRRVEFQIMPRRSGRRRGGCIFGRINQGCRLILLKHILGSQGGLKVEVANIKCGELGAGARENAVEDELGKFK